MVYIRFKREGKVNWEIARTDEELAWKLNGDMAEVVCPAKFWAVRVWRKLFPLKGISAPLGEQTTSLTNRRLSEKLLRAINALFQVVMIASIVTIAPAILAALTVVAFMDVWKTVHIELGTLLAILQVGFGLSLLALWAFLSEK